MTLAGRDIFKCLVLRKGERGMAKYLKERKSFPRKKKRTGFEEGNKIRAQPAQGRYEKNPAKKRDREYFRGPGRCRGWRKDGNRPPEIVGLKSLLLITRRGDFCL